MSRRGYKKDKPGRFGMFLVCMVVAFMLLIVSVKCMELKGKQTEYLQKKEALTQQYEQEQARAEELKEFDKYVHTDSYSEEIAENQLGFVHENEIIFEVK